MGHLSSITTGLTPMPPRLLIYGTEGVGKSTFASSAPKPIFTQTEDGLSQIGCSRFQLSKTFEEARDQAVELLTEKHDFSTYVIDSADWLEKLVWRATCVRFQKQNIEDFGYNKGYNHTMDEWKLLISLWDDLRTQRNMAIIIIAHAKIEKFEDPEQAAYDRYSPRMHKMANALFTEWADAVLFATRRSTVMKDGKGFDERVIATPIGANGGERILRCVGSPACVAKNRYRMPDTLPLSWAAVSEHILKGN